MTTEEVLYSKYLEVLTRYEALASVYKTAKEEKNFLMSRMKEITADSANRTRTTRGNCDGQAYRQLVSFIESLP